MGGEEGAEGSSFLHHPRMHSGAFVATLISELRVTSAEGSPGFSYGAEDLEMGSWGIARRRIASSGGRGRLLGFLMEMRLPPVARLRRGTCRRI